MPENQLKLAVVSALRASPDFSQLQALNAAPERQERAFLRWLDQSGLALYLAWQLQKEVAFACIPARVRSHLQNALQSNHLRTAAMLSDFHALSEFFSMRGVRHAFLKGFTLAPEFCPDLELRHQSDIDILVPADAAHEARAAILGCGYSLERKLIGGETHFSTKLARIPSVHDDIYRADYQKEVELHSSIWEDVEQVSLRVPSDCLDRIRERHIKGISFASLGGEDAVVVQFLHVFRHVLSSWVRLSWLWEIHYFLSHHAEDSFLWTGVRNRSGDDPLVRNAFGLILELTNELFASPIPEVLREWCIEPLPERIHCWVSELGTRWALSEMSGNKLNLLIHKDFMRDATKWRRYLWRRLVPLEGRPSLGKGAPSGQGARIRFSQRTFQARRAAFHAKSLVSFPYEAWRWKRALVRRNAGAQSVRDVGRIRGEKKPAATAFLTLKINAVKNGNFGVKAVTGDERGRPL